MKDDASEGNIKIQLIAVSLLVAIPVAAAACLAIGCNRVRVDGDAAPLTTKLFAPTYIAEFQGDWGARDSDSKRRGTTKDTVYLPLKADGTGTYSAPIDEHGGLSLEPVRWSVYHHQENDSNHDPDYNEAALTFPKNPNSSATADISKESGMLSLTVDDSNSSLCLWRVNRK